MGGSQNLLDEMRFADAWDNAHWSDRCRRKDLVTMATSERGDGARRSATGSARSQVGYSPTSRSRGRPPKPYDAVVAATPKDVRS